jgi:hypothetical protein
MSLERMSLHRSCPTSTSTIHDATVHVRTVNDVPTALLGFAGLTSRKTEKLVLPDYNSGIVFYEQATGGSGRQNALFAHYPTDRLEFVVQNQEIPRVISSRRTLLITDMVLVGS